MADRLDIGRLTLNESQHAPQQNGFPERAAYIPPHLRNSRPSMRNGPPGMDGTPPMNGDINGHNWGGSHGYDCNIAYPINSN